MHWLRALFSVPETATRTAAALLVVRVVFGATLAIHGFGKIKNPLHWMDKAANPPPAVLQLLAAVSEFVGGLALAAGLLTPLAAAGVLCTMGYAAYSHWSKGDPYVGKGGGAYELATLYFVAVLAVVMAGPGRFSLDALAFGKKRPTK
jgi:putative oxidoreductase